MTGVARCLSWEENFCRAVQQEMVTCQYAGDTAATTTLVLAFVV